MRFPTMRLETLPNRDSLLYKDLYNIPDVHSICRGTLRYEGWSNIMYALRVLGVFEPSAPAASTFKELLTQKLNVSSGGSQELKSALQRHLEAGGVRGESSRSTFCQYIVHLCTDNVSFYIIYSSHSTDIPAAVEAIAWLGLLDAAVPMSDPSSPLDSMCSLLTNKLQFSESEKDMVRNCM